LSPFADLDRSIPQILRTLAPSADRDARSRRVHVRRPVNVRVQLDGKLTGEGWALNLSAGGIRILTDADVVLSVGDMLRLRIDAGEHHGTGLTGHGRVVWLKRCPDGLVGGIQFVEPL